MKEETRKRTMNALIELNVAAYVQKITDINFIFGFLFLRLNVPAV
ncbi:MAG: hypothetical protein ACETWK_02380 [Candidatus Aminicenantaceae bacterium]